MSLGTVQLELILIFVLLFIAVILGIIALAAVMHVYLFYKFSREMKTAYHSFETTRSSVEKLIAELTALTSLLHDKVNKGKELYTAFNDAAGIIKAATSDLESIVSTWFPKAPAQKGSSDVEKPAASEFESAEDNTEDELLVYERSKN